MERPFVPLAENTRPFAAGGWPVLGYEGDPELSEADLARGASIYRRSCSHCHGQAGRGDGPVAESLKRPAADLRSWSVQLMEPESLRRLVAHPKSIMPPFVGRLTRRERDLVVHYVQSSFRPSGEPEWRGAAGSRVDLGERIYADLDCDRCHGAQRDERTPGLPPSLDFAGNKLRIEWVREYLARPHRIRYEAQDVASELRMPSFRLAAPEVAALAAYLAGRRQDERFGDSGVDWRRRAGAAAIEDGRRLFMDYACQGCHQVDGEGNRVGPELTHVGSRLEPEYIYKFISDPGAYVPNTPMKNNDLWPEEAEAITRFLRTLE